MRLPLRIPPPLPCAITLALVIATFWREPHLAELPPGVTADDRVDDSIEGTVGGPIARSEHGLGAPLDRIAGTGTTTIWIWTDAPIEPGQRVVAVGLLRTPRGFLAPGSPDRAQLLATRGASWELDARSIRVLADTPDLVGRIWRAAAATQYALSAQLPADTGAGAALRGIVTGDRSRIPPTLDDRWRVAGIFHVLSVSGLHLAVIAGLAFALLRRLIASSPWGGRTRPARWAAPIALALAIAYTLVTGAQLATVRALVVVAVALVGQMLDRPLRLVDAIGVAAIAILAWRPCDVFDASFQLSFVAALTLALRPRGGNWLRRGLMTSLWVAVTTAPITALHFQQVAAGGVIGNLVLTPVVELAALPLGLAGAVLGPIAHVGPPLVALATWLVQAVDIGAGLVARAIPVGAIALGSVAIMALLVTCGLVLSARAHRTRVDALLLAGLCIGWATSRSPPPSGALRITFLDVGQGDAAVVELPGGSTWLVDAGGLASAGSPQAASSPGVAIDRLLGVYGKASIEIAILSHPHPDHYLGLTAITRPIRELWFADTDEMVSDTMFHRIAHDLSQRGTRLVTPKLGTTRTPDGVELTVWAPRYGDVLASDPVRGTNDNSLVVEIAYAGRTFLFAGDLEAEGESALVEAGLPNVDVVKVPHHGSPTSSTAAFVAATAPVLAVISCGAANAFGFPSAEVVARWEANGAEVARTDRDGSITVTVRSNGAMSIDRFRDLER